MTFVPLPHSSGASTWLNDPGHRALLAEAIERVREKRMRGMRVRFCERHGQRGDEIPLAR